MGTRRFNILDIIIANLRLGKVKRYLDKNDILLDFGCGSQGYLLNSLKNNLREGLGLDYDVDDTIISPQIKLKKFRFQKNLPLKDNCCTKITLLAVIEHLPLGLITPLFAEFNRILKPGGLIILTTPTPESKPLMEFLAKKLHLISVAEVMDHKKYYSRQDLGEIAKNSGLKIKEYQQFQFGLNSLCLLQKY